MTEYRCRACRRLLFRSDATWGRLEALCPRKRCQTLQTIYLGGRASERPLSFPRVLAPVRPNDAVSERVGDHAPVAAIGSQNVAAAAEAS